MIIADGDTNAGIPTVPADESTNNVADLVFAPNSTKVMLTLQRPLMRLVIHESFENLRLSLLVSNAFPDYHLALCFVKEALITAANTYRPGSEVIYQ